MNYLIGQRYIEEYSIGYICVNTTTFINNIGLNIVRQYIYLYFKDGI